MKAEVISIDTDLVLGQLTDFNNAHLASQFPLYGFDWHFISKAGDYNQQVIETPNYPWQISDIVLPTGVLCPKENALTEKVIADLSREPAFVNENVAHQSPALFRRFDMEYGIVFSRDNSRPERTIIMGIDTSKQVHQFSRTLSGAYLQVKQRMAVAASFELRITCYRRQNAPDN